MVSGCGWDATIAQASIDERGQAHGGAGGDQTDHETSTRGVYTYWAGWDCILRYMEDDAVTDDDIQRVADAVAERMTTSRQLWGYRNE